jgi:uncharacterized membrane protein
MYSTVKLIHILSATLLFGTGLGSAVYLYLAYKTKDMKVMAQVNRMVVWVDYIVTAPLVVVQLLSGLVLAHLLSLTLTSAWALSVFFLYGFVGLCWLPVVVLQIKLRDKALHLKAPDQEYKILMRWWLILGALAFPAVLVLYFFMVFKPLL